MKTKSHKNPKVNVITLGCSKNLVDSEVIMGQLRASDFDVHHEADSESDIVIINTCGFIDNAKEESINTILRFAGARKEGDIEKLYVTGCLSHRYKDELKDEIPEVDAWFGTLDMPALLRTVGADYKHELLGERLQTTPRHYAYVKISEGCNRPCSFCAIPLMRGGHISKPIETITAEIEGLVKNGTKEVMLIAQDSTYYGLDLYGERKLADLLRSVSDIKGLEWARLHYAFPSQFPMDALDVLAEKSNLCNYLDIPVQHISDSMLKIMRRGITKKRTLELLDTIREKVPGIALRTTLLVGHPGETEQDFEELLQFVKDYRFDRLGVFTYSHEENTHAYSLQDDIPQEEKDRRAEAIMAAQQEISEDLNRHKVGTTLKVLFDRLEGDFFVGRTEADSPEVDNEVWVPAEGNYVRMGDFAQVVIDSHTPYDLYGHLAPIQ
ncbi:MAG: 30S ribosomal protein S12 methylthiotransferase RimO [Bacteroidetes bacterium]|nr:30S ribosomal protein S12 methylthiotransferase RimO [Bacteroidota bacterium]